MNKEPSITVCPPGRRSKQVALKPKTPEPPIDPKSPTAKLSQAARLNKMERERQADIKAVVLAQPHRVGISDFPTEAWQASELGRYCCRTWGDRSHRKHMWSTGERFARLIDAERIARGMTPRQCAEEITFGEGDDIEERRRKIAKCERELRDAEEEIRLVDDRAVRAIRVLAYEDKPISPYDEGRVMNGLWRLSRHFEAIDRRERAS